MHPCRRNPTWEALRPAPPQGLSFYWFPKTARPKLALVAGRIAAVAHFIRAPTVATAVIVAIGRPPPESEPSALSTHAYASCLNVKSVSHLPSLNKSARFVRCVWIIGRHSAQVTGDVELRHKVCVKTAARVTESFRAQPHLSFVLVMELKGVDDHVELIVLHPGEEVGP